MLGAAEWKKCKKGVRVVNCARGGLYNEQDLAEAVKEGIVASVGLDVVVDEPNPISPLIGMPQCVVTPHLGASTFEAQDKVGLAIAEEVINVLGGKMVQRREPSCHCGNGTGRFAGLPCTGGCLGKTLLSIEKSTGGPAGDYSGCASRRRR